MLVDNARTGRTNERDRGTGAPIAAGATGLVAGGLALRPSLTTRTPLQQLGLVAANAGAGFAAGAIVDRGISPVDALAPGDRTTAALGLAGAGAVVAGALRALPGSRGLAASTAMTLGGVTAVAAGVAGVAGLATGPTDGPGNVGTLASVAAGGAVTTAMLGALVLRAKGSVGSVMARGVDNAPHALAPALEARLPKPAHQLVASVSGAPGSVISRERMGTLDKKWVDAALPGSHIDQLRGDGGAMDAVRVVSPLRGTPEQQVELAIQDLIHHRGLERGTIAVGAPASGHPFFAPWEAIETMTRGDVASVVLPWGRKPIWFATHHSPRGLENQRLFLARLDEEIAKLPPDKRPRVISYGESWGAEINKRVLMQDGGMARYNVDTGVGIGAPRLLEHERAAAAARLVKGTDDGVTAMEYGSVEEYRRRVAQLGGREPDMHFPTNPDDVVARISPTSLVQRPAWLARDRAARPDAVPAGMGYAPFVTTTQLLNDMVTLLGKPGGGHEYSSINTVGFVRDAFGWTKGTDDATVGILQEYVNRANAAR